MRYFIANWKMYADHRLSVELATAYRALAVPAGVKVAVAPTALEFSAVTQAVTGSDWQLAAQNSAWAAAGAYTGAISAHLYAEAGARYTIIGHSERRHIFGEGDTSVAKKVAAAVEAGLTPILCIGETQEDLVANKRQYRLKKQLQALESIPVTAPIMIAYEPVWAITGSGSGQPCLPADVEDVHGFIRTELAILGFVDCPILYGGSVTADNAASYVLPEVAGFLVGSASLKIEEVEKILTCLG